jgi:hypothetical protein
MLICHYFIFKTVYLNSEPNKLCYIMSWYVSYKIYALCLVKKPGQGPVEIPCDFVNYTSSPLQYFL